MTNNEGRKLQAILANLNAISEDRSRYEPFLDQICEQWQGVTFSLSRMLLLLARQQLQNTMIQRMLDLYADATGLPHGAGALKYQKRLVSPSALPGFARSCLSAALSLDPENMYAALLMGMALEEDGDLKGAADWYEKSAGLRGVIGGVGLWLAARAFEKSGDTGAALRAYKAAEATQGHWRQIELVHLAHLHMQKGHFQEALPLFGRAAEYKWQSLIELFFDLPREPGPTAIDIEAPVRCDVTPPIIDPVLHKPCVVYRWYDRYYAVLASLDPIRPIELTGQGLRRNGFGAWRRAFAVFRRLPGLYRFCAPLLRRLPIVRTACRQFERSLTRSSPSLNGLATGHIDAMPSQHVVGFIDADGYEYRICRYQGLYFAIPNLIADYSWRSIDLGTEYSLKALIALAAARRFPTLLKIAYHLSRNHTRPFLLHILNERILSAAGLHELASRFEFREGTRS